jgi:hypothetical protein
MHHALHAKLLLRHLVLSNLSTHWLWLSHHHGVVEMRGTDLAGHSILLLLVLAWHRLDHLALCLAHQIVGLLLLLRDLLRHHFLDWLPQILH